MHERAETNIKELMDSPTLDQDKRIVIRPVIEHSDLKLMSMTIQSGSSIRSKASRLVRHPQQDKDVTPIEKPDLSLKDMNLPSVRSKGYSFNGNVLIR